MRRALIQGTRVCQVEDSDFPVAIPMHWVDCPDDMVADQFTYEDGEFKPVPPRPPAPKVPPEDFYKGLSEIVRSGFEAMGVELGLTAEEVKDRIISVHAAKDDA